MSLSPAVIDTMVAAGCTVEQLAEAFKAAQRMSALSRSPQVNRVADLAMHGLTAPQIVAALEADQMAGGTP